MAGVYFIFFVGVIFGLILTVVWDLLERKILFKKVKAEAKNIFETAKAGADDFFYAYKRSCEVKNENKFNIFEKEKDILKSNLQSLQSKINKRFNENKRKERKLEAQINQNKKIVQDLRSQKKFILKEKKEHQILFEKLLEKKINCLKNKFSFSVNQLKEEIKKELKEEWIDEIRTRFSESTQNQQSLKKSAVLYLNLVLSRFDRISRSERGVFYIKFRDENHLKSTLGKGNIYANQLEKECGIDIVVNTENLQASIMGLDPVRREWGRISLEKLSSRSKVNFSAVKKIVKLTKRKLFSTIREDGIKICGRLKLKNVSPEVQNMMGALRYRYSFAQNQYFHCEEVGWLCGLLSAELSLPVKPGQRSGMFHDIGKAMDHSIRGNHAVIGAEFLSQYNEDKDILHAVRAHHYNETPSTPLAYLVITADSISGSRPGARRFVEDSYSQKIARLEEILHSFDVIQSAFIMSAGRELRVIVDPEKADDRESVELSREIAKTVEKECSYPGLIKVTVVRRSEAYATA